MAMNLALPSEHYAGHGPSHCKRKVCPLAWGIVSYQSDVSRGLSGLLCVARGPFPMAAAMMMKVVVGC